MNRTIQIKENTKKRLDKLGTVSSTYDSILKELLDQLEEIGSTKSD